MTWQPISTAPRDGTPVLCYGRPTGEICGEYADDMAMVCTYGYGRWHLEGADTYSVTMEARHWMPLPQPPGGE
jgi:phage gpG-like protein